MVTILPKQNQMSGVNITYVNLVRVSFLVVYMSGAGHRQGLIWAQRLHTADKNISCSRFINSVVLKIMNSTKIKLQYKNIMRGKADLIAL